MSKQDALISEKIANIFMYIAAAGAIIGFPIWVVGFVLQFALDKEDWDGIRSYLEIGWVGGFSVAIVGIACMFLTFFLAQFLDSTKNKNEVASDIREGSRALGVLAISHAFTIILTAIIIWIGFAIVVSVFKDLTLSQALANSISNWKYMAPITLITAIAVKYFK